MRFTITVTLILVTSLSGFASTSAAQSPPPAQSAHNHQPSNPAVPGEQPIGQGAGMMSPDMMQMVGQMMGHSQGAGGRGSRSGGPLQGISRLMSALDDPRARTMLGLTDQQADSLRKIIVDTETFTITTGATIAVDSINLRELLRADKPDRTTVMARGDEISRLTSQLINHYLEAMLSAKAILTPEQQKMLRAYMENGAPAL